VVTLLQVEGMSQSEVGKCFWPEHFQPKGNVFVVQ
jgi:hypothetical protein